MLRIRCPLCLGLVHLLSAIVAGADPQPVPFSPAVERVLAWFPEDTESVVVSQAFVMPRSTGDRVLNGEPTFVEALAAASVAVPGELHDGKYLGLLQGKKVTAAICGGRNFEYVSGTLPSWRSESCLVLVFEEDLELRGAEWVKAVGEGARETLRIAGHDVFAFPPLRSMRAQRKGNWPGLGVYLALVAPDTVLCATSRGYLEQVLTRIGQPPVRRALPGQLRKWRDVDPNAPAWMVRHTPESLRWNDSGRIDDVSWTATRDRLCIVYPPGTIAPDRLEKMVRSVWSGEQIKRQPAIERLKDDTILVTLETDGLESVEMFWPAFALYHLEAGLGGQ